jgi:hypothetical protein
MIVPAKPHYFEPERFARGNIKRGETFSVDSGLGGSHTVEYLCHDEAGRVVFVREARPGWPRAMYIYVNEQDAARNVYILVPENPNF